MRVDRDMIRTKFAVAITACNNDVLQIAPCRVEKCPAGYLQETVGTTCVVAVVHRVANASLSFRLLPYTAALSHSRV